MLDINKLKETGYFKTGVLKSGDILFDEGDFDNNLYIIETGKVSIEKYISKDEIELKELAVLGEKQIFGEGSLTNNNPKEVRIKALEKTQLLKINGVKDFENFLKEYPKEGIQVLGSIIDYSNKRLLEANYLITSSYSILKYISELKDFSNKNLFLVIDKIFGLLDAEYILYIEKSPVFENVFLYRYDTREKGKMQEKVLEINDSIGLIGILVDKPENELVLKLKTGNQIIGYLIISSNKELIESQIKSLGNIGVSLAGFIRQKQYYESIKDIYNIEI